MVFSMNGFWREEYNNLLDFCLLNASFYLVYTIS